MSTKTKNDSVRLEGNVPNLENAIQMGMRLIIKGFVTGVIVAIIAGVIIYLALFGPDAVKDGKTPTEEVGGRTRGGISSAESYERIPVSPSPRTGQIGSGPSS